MRTIYWMEYAEKTPAGWVFNSQAPTTLHRTSGSALDEMHIVWRVLEPRAAVTSHYLERAVEAYQGLRGRIGKIVRPPIGKVDDTFVLLNSPIGAAGATPVGIAYRMTKETNL